MTRFAAIAGTIGLVLMLYGLGAQGGVVRAIYPSPPKPDLQAEHEAAMLARWDAERAIRLLQHTSAAEAAQ